MREVQHRSKQRERSGLPLQPALAQAKVANGLALTH